MTLEGIQAQINKLETLVYEIDARVSALVDNVNILRGGVEPTVTVRKRRNVTVPIEGE